MTPFPVTPYMQKLRMVGATVLLVSFSAAVACGALLGSMLMALIFGGLSFSCLVALFWPLYYIESFDGWTFWTIDHDGGASLAKPGWYSPDFMKRVVAVQPTVVEEYSLPQMQPLPKHPAQGIHPTAQYAVRWVVEFKPVSAVTVAAYYQWLQLLPNLRRNLYSTAVRHDNLGVRRLLTENLGMFNHHFGRLGTLSAVVGSYEPHTYRSVGGRHEDSPPFTAIDKVA